MTSQRTAESPAPPGKYETIDGLDLFVRRSHDPITSVDVVMIHGLGGMSTNWSDLMHLQAHRGRTVAALDLPGFGRSEGDPGNDYSLDRHARAVIAFLEVQDAPVHLVGNSLGGAIATTVAAERPDLVETLTLLAPAMPHFRLKADQLPILLGLLPNAPRLLERTLGAKSAERRVDEMMSLCFGDTSRINPQRRAEAVTEHRLRAGLPHIWEAFVESSRGLGRHFLPWGESYLWNRLDRVEAPVLCIFGTLDRLVDPKVAGRVAKTIGGGTVVVLPGVGHTPQMEVPVTVDRLLDAHILGQL